MCEPRPTFFLVAVVADLAAHCLYAVYTSLPSAMISQSESVDHPRVRPPLNIQYSYIAAISFFFF